MSSANYWWSIDELNVYSSFSEPATTTTTTRAKPYLCRRFFFGQPWLNRDLGDLRGQYLAQADRRERDLRRQRHADFGVHQRRSQRRAARPPAPRRITRPGRSQSARSYSGSGTYLASSSATYSETINLPADGYWLATANGQVYGNGAAQSFGNVATSAVTGPVVGIAGTPDHQGLLGSNG